MQNDEEIEEVVDVAEVVIEENTIRTRAIRKLIFLVGFTGIMLIMATYAWFSTQRNVSLSNLEGTVKVAEGLEISLDALNWSQGIDFSEYTDQNDLKRFYGETEHNIIPTEMLPVSTTGKSGTGDTIGGNELIMYRGENTDSIKLTNIQATSKTITDATNNQYPGYYAIDFFLRNNSREEGEDVLQLNTDSSLMLKAGGAYTTGLQNTVRVGFALYNSTTPIAASVSEQSTILGAMTGDSVTIKDVAIWEPNAKDHVDYIVINNNKITWKAADKLGYIADQTNGKYTATERIPTYALMSTAVGQEYTDIYKWDGSVTGLEKQITLQTDKLDGTYKIAGGVQNLISVSSAETALYENNPSGEVTTFKIPKNQICRIRMYVWLEGQDVDCTNYASHGGGIIVDVGLTKGETEGTGGSTETGPYIPSGFSEVAGTSLDTGYTIQDSTENQYVWVEVPQTAEVYPTAGLDITTFTDEEYTAIENDLHTYTSVYRNGTTFTDTYSGDDASTGLTSTQYTELKQKMLKSVYQNGGFYVGKYETGIEAGPKTSGDASTPPTETAVIKQNAYPYNWVTCSQAQSLASGMESGEYTSSLMFGVQWDLVLKYMETKAVEQGTDQETIQSALNSNSTSWGNYYNNLWNITNASSKYAVNGSNWTSGAYGEKTADSSILLSTGASDTFSKQGIYDLAGNVREWTLEFTSNTSSPCATRGGYYNFSRYNIPASYRSNNSTTNYYNLIGFRSSLF